MSMMPEDIIEWSKQKLVDELEKLNDRNEDIMASMVAIRTELLHRLEEENKDGELIGEYSVTRAKRVTFKTDLEDAMELGAVKQVPDTTALKKLYNKGIEIPKTIITTYLSVRRLSQEEVVNE